MAKTTKKGSEITSKKKSKTNKMQKKRIERNYTVQSIKEVLDAVDKREVLS